MGSDFKFELGQEARDKITGFQGILTGRCQHLYGCNTYCLVKKNQKAKVENGEWFDEGRIEIVGRGIQPKEVQVTKPGGSLRDLPRIR